MSQNIFSDDLNAFISEWKEKPGNRIMILHKVQEEFGYISREAADEVSRQLGVPLATIWGVLTFYHFFKLGNIFPYLTPSVGYLYIYSHLRVSLHYRAKLSQSFSRTLHRR